jgi:exopolysaccharide biosynthesis predicted pyruvyltransferase EpsI
VSTVDHAVRTADDQALIARLCERSARTIAPFLGEPPYALVDFPFHLNAGDSMIWLGERQLLRACGVEIAYTCDARSYDAHELRRRIGRGTVLLHGGGNLGDLWPHHEQLREQVIADFRTHRIVQLPQTIHFEDMAALDRARRVFERHPRLTLLVRDERSFDVAQQAFGIPSALCPDSAFHLGPLSAPAARAHARGIVWLARTDHEARAQHVVEAPDVRVGDWPPRSPRSPRTLREPGDLVNRCLTRALLADRNGRVGRATAHTPNRLRLAVYDRWANERLGTGRDFVATGKVVVTDRMHGHVLCVLLGLPHVVLPDRFGKVRSMWDGWTASTATGHWADSPADALNAARALLAEAA